MSAEQFTRDQVVSAIDAFLQYAESEEGKSQHGYFSGGGWAARCLRAHKAVLESLRPADGVPPPLTSEQIKPLAAGSAFESEAFAQRIAAARDAQWLALRPAAQPVGEPKGIGMGAQALAGELAAALNADLGTENAIGMLGANTMAWLRTVASVYLAQPVGEPVADVPREWREALQRLVFVAKNSAQNCGCGPDPLLKAAINQACLLLHDRYNYTDTKPAPTTDAARDVLAERQRQIEAEGWTPEHDDVHEIAELAYAAACYTLADLEVFTDTPPAFWPWAPEWWKPRDRRRNLIKAGALILAEIERIDRAAKKGGQL